MTINSRPREPESLKYQLLSQIEERELRFLWYPYVPIGTATLLFGYGGLGKSFLACSLASDISAGRPLHGIGNPALPPQKVLIVSAEDDPGYVILPRMRRMNANLDNIFVSDDSFTLDRRGLDRLRKVMREVAATVVFLDPLVSYLGGKMDINKANESRAMIGPLMEAARENDSAIVVVHHSKKASEGRSANRALGSVDFLNGVRSALMVDEDAEGRHFMEHVKHNWTAQGPSLEYKVEDEAFQWIGPYKWDYAKSASLISRQPRVTDKAREWLRDVLKCGPIAAKDLFSRMKDAKISMSSINTAKKGIAFSRKEPGLGWMWYPEETLPESNNFKDVNNLTFTDMAEMVAAAQRKLEQKQ